MPSPIFVGAVVAALACSTCARAGDPVEEVTFPSEGISKVVLRAANAKSASVNATSLANAPIVISARPTGGAGGYHSSDPNWKETPAETWGLSFVSQRFGSVLVISSKNEVQYIHHRYLLANIVVQVPAGVAVVTERREPSGNGTPNLAAP